jgi:Ca2+-binding RTX toxin-like protein
MKKSTLALALATSLVAVGAGVASSAVTAYTTLPKCNGKFATILSNAALVHGTSYDDVIIIYGSGAHTIYGFQGDDTICGSDGADLIWGGRGIDWISAGASNDVVHGGDSGVPEVPASGADYVQGDAGNDLIYGEEGNDELHGGAGNDVIYGGAGNDFMFGEAGSDSMYGEAGTDAAPDKQPGELKD